MANFLNIHCPKCEACDSIYIETAVWLHVAEHGLKMTADEFGDQSSACCGCGYASRLGDFSRRPAEKEQCLN